jgi:DegV family protein with EDD domain
MIEAAARLAGQGASADEVAACLDDMRPRLRLFAILSTLEFLQRGGRIGRAAALAGTLLNVKPILEVRDGEVRPLERVRTLNLAIRRLVEIVVGVGEIERLAVVHGAAQASAQELEHQLEPHFPSLEIEHGEIGAVLGVHAGPGVFGTAMLLAH